MDSILIWAYILLALYGLFGLVMTVSLVNDLLKKKNNNFA